MVQNTFTIASKKLRGKSGQATQQSTSTMIQNAPSGPTGSYRLRDSGSANSESKKLPLESKLKVPGLFT